MDKYYSPTLDEFYHGFEYQELWENFDTKEEDWRTTIFGESIEVYESNRIQQICNGVYHSFTFEGRIIRQDKIRVKHLDEADLLEIGFAKTKNDFKSIFEFVMNNGRYFIHLESTWFSNGECVIQIETSVEIDSIKTLVVHSIRIRNKSELKVLLKQLGI